MNRNENGAIVAPHEVDMADFREVQNTPKWTLSGSVNYDTPIGSGRLNLNSTLSYRSKSQQFEIATPGLDQKGFALLDASIVWRSAGDRFTIGLHGKNLTDKHYKTSGYQYINSTVAGVPILNAAGGYTPTLGREGVATAFYGNPRQVFLSVGAKF